jgi:isochorismate synthase
MDSLIYRLPNSEAIIKRKGRFGLRSTGQETFGFLVSDFLHQRIFSFEDEGELETFIPHDLITKPLVISQRDYQIEAQGMLHAFPVMGVQKAVYSRVKAVAFDWIKAEEMFRSLTEKYPQAFVYLISSPHFGTWIGATPEILLERKGLEIKTVALASTKASNEESEWTSKELAEHQFVVEALAEVLNRNNCFSIEKDGPKEHQAGPVKHLITRFSALLSQPNAWQLAMDLHPTPAVCGTPRMAAMDLLLSREMHDRELYTGMIGVFGEQANLFVNLRCARLTEKMAYLFLGGGYTIESIPDLEWEETENKAKTLLNVMRDL